MSENEAGKIDTKFSPTRKKKGNANGTPQKSEHQVHVTKFIIPNLEDQHISNEPDCARRYKSNANLGDNLYLDVGNKKERMCVHGR